MSEPFWKKLFCGMCLPTRLPPEVYTSGSSILYSEEGFSGVLVITRFLTYKQQLINAAMAITSTELFCYCNHNPVLRVKWTNERLARMKFETKQGKRLLVIRWDANLFDYRRLGKLELRLRVQDPVDFLSKIQEQISKHKRMKENN
jgi:hypothetical protein